MKSTLPSLHKLTTLLLAISLILQYHMIVVTQRELLVATELLKREVTAAQGTQKQLDAARVHITEQQKQLDDLQDKVQQAQAAASAWYTSSAIATAYSPYDDQNGINSEGSHKITSTGTKPGIGTFAVDPQRIPYGSQIVITFPNGTVEKGIACDTGGAMRDAAGISIDVFRYTFAEAMTFGKCNVTINWKPPK